ncbi:hypothetical protein BTO19_17855 [Vibrio parahaemolyticus]|nr:hypothetical protein [Vibrio parahaemolyticus]MCA6721282.1 hypothetical protein [Vibrio alginolyticus]MDW2259903.1 hypothetical protein [Vibrio sp. 1409]EGR2893510.1 hypothetical protein [Vibrio parahaemolyticus]EGR2931282.1 hypothetical protein [Vibrio parahaemolyticus]EGR2958350.1 hypothetical protein [Vibrio parahaemolyticus]
MRDQDADMNLDELLNDDFFDDLGEPDASEIKSDTAEMPDWVGDAGSTTHNAWRAINELKPKKINSIKKCKKPNDKTAKSLYQISKADVSKLVGISAQSIFRTSSFSPSILAYFDDVNSELLTYFNKRKKTAFRTQNTGIRTRKKEQLVQTYQQMEKEMNALKQNTTKDLLDAVVAGMPLDLRIKLNL